MMKRAHWSRRDALAGLAGAAVAALYVPQRSAHPEVLLSQTGPRRMALRFVREFEAELFLTSLDAGMRKHYSPA